MNRYVTGALAVIVMFATAACDKVTTSDGGTTTNGDSRLIGTWDTGCLTPDADSPYSEKHGWVIMEDGETAVKTDINYDAVNCGGSTILSQSTSYVLEIKETVDETATASLKIDLTAASGSSSGTTIYDIYQVTATKLLFGHGFRNTLSYAGAVGAGSDGATEAGRITTLNEYLVYTKQ